MLCLAINVHAISPNDDRFALVWAIELGARLYVSFGVIIADAGSGIVL